MNRYRSKYPDRYRHRHRLIYIKAVGRLVNGIRNGRLNTVNNGSF